MDSLLRKIAADALLFSTFLSGSPAPVSSVKPPSSFALTIIDNQKEVKIFLPDFSSKISSFRLKDAHF